MSENKNEHRQARSLTAQEMLDLRHGNKAVTGEAVTRLNPHHQQAVPALEGRTARRDFLKKAAIATAGGVVLGKAPEILEAVAKKLDASLAGSDLRGKPPVPRQASGEPVILQNPSNTSKK